jgi:hypothetical protein
LVKAIGASVSGSASKTLESSFPVLIKSLIYSAALVLTAFASSRAASPRDVQVHSSGPTGISFTLKNAADLNGLQKITGADSSVNYVASVQVGIPYGTSARLSNVSWGSLDPLQKTDRSIEQGGRPAPQVLVSQPITVRGRQIVTVSVYPVVESGIYGTVQITLNFAGGVKAGVSIPAKEPTFDRIFKAALINYDQFIQWPAPAPPVSRLASITAGPLSQATSWYKIAVNQTGLCRITGSDLAAAGVSLANLRSDSVRIFNAGGLQLDMDNSKPRPVFEEIAIDVQDGGDGIFNSGDQIYFYGEAVDRWVYSASAAPAWVNNLYTSNNVYWLAVSGSFSTPSRRWSRTDVTPSGQPDTVITTFTRRAHVEQDNILLQDNSGHVDNYGIWYWTDSSYLNFYVNTPGVVSGQTAQVYLDGRTGGMNLRFNSAGPLSGSCTSYFCNYTVASPVDGLNSVQLAFQPLSSSYKSFFNYLEISYLSRTIPDNDRLDITLDNLTGRARIQVQDNFTSSPIILDLADPRQPALDTGFARSGGLVTFTAEVSPARVNRFYCATRATAVSPVSITPDSPADLRSIPSQTDLIAITPRAFMGALSEYVDYRRRDGHSIRVYSVEDIMDNFSYGMVDPTAIRDFLKYTFENYPAPTPSATLLVGDANYDYRNRLQALVPQPNLVPSYVNPFENQPLGNAHSDDNYVYFGSFGILDSDTSFVRHDRGYDMMITRWPVDDAGQIADIVQKIKAYELPGDLGAWRTTITLVADDEFHEGSSNEFFHTTQTEDLERNHVPRFMNRQKIYSIEYPFVNRSKPAVNDAIVNTINDGTLIVNYVGHGNPDVWADERIFTRTGDLPRLRNSHMPLVFAASCAIGFFDDPRREAMGEEFITQANSGAIGVVSAMGLAFASDNSQFNQQTYDILLNEDSLSINEAVYTAKLLRQYGLDSVPRPLSNDRGYLYFGDPYLRLGLPRLRVNFANAPDSLVALGRTVVSGRIVDRNGNTVVKDGLVSVSVYDSDRDKTYKAIPYTTPGPRIFRGPAEIHAGEFRFEFITPLDIGYGGKSARISVYAVLDSVDAIGLVDSIPVSGVVTATTDSVGPKIEYAVGDRKVFVDGEEVSKEENLQITLSDSSGINLSGGLGHGITLELDSRPENNVNITDLFSYETGDYTTGKLVYPLNKLETGEHSFKIKAWDNANNSSTAQFSIKLVSSSRMAINDLLNYPNPMKGRSNTTFFFELTAPANRFSLEIFTLSGKKIRSFVGENLGADNYPNRDFEAVWDGRDADGDEVATGVYIYKATALPQSGGGSVESFGKVVVIN